MRQHSVQFEFTADKSCYWFISDGDSKVQKAVLFDEMAVKGRFNLSLADIVDGKLDFNRISNNHDHDVLFDTIASIAFDYTKKYPSRDIFLTGSSKARTRMYQMKIANNLNDINVHYNVYGLLSENSPFVPFQKGTNYIGFLLSKK